MNKKALLHLINEFAPVIAFFIAAQFFSFYTATAVLVASTLLALAAGWLFDKRFPILPIISGFFIITSGLITIYYKAPDALIVADSAYYLLMGGIILTGLFFKVNILKLIFNRTFAIQDIGWKILAQRWVVIFLLAGAANEVARFALSPEEWVNFKVLKVITITVFGFYQFTLSRKYKLSEGANEWGLRTD